VLARSSRIPAQGVAMAQRCDVCGKHPSVGNTVSHAHKLTRRRWLPNLVSMRALMQGKPTRVRVCTRCLKAGKVTKVI
jgi:large subunit ribosomal protein L28